ncbi:unnamed protein product [Moneuplotes crassus]|uniref:Endoplasmic reticulum vesicle transporter C-terminal domain-containing protein n=1 Tax=Euplotes crassus TaxID=5936 RepID=A0AAD2CZD6_EUPCR|nr:unnamed protein product [Moneuplotes crassus]
MIIVSLCMFEIQALFDNNVVRVLKIEQMDPHEKIQINIDIDFPATPYDVISLDIQDEMGTHMVNVKDSIKKLLKQVKGVIIGDISVNRVPGNFHIESHAYMQLLAMLGQQINLTHTIHNLSFGNKRVLRSVQKKIKDKTGEFKYLIGHKEISEELGTSTNYQLNLVPTLYRDNFGFKHSVVYQYTYTVGSENIGNKVVYFKYFINGITVDYMQTADTFLQFIIRICTIIGGVFTMFHILSVMLNKSINVLYKERIGKKD